MDEIDEDIIPRSAPAGEDVDLSEETQDFRFLATAVGNDAKIPKRGEKDFEPHKTVLQTDTLAASRHAMHNALSFQRTNRPNATSMVTYHPESNMAYAMNPKGPLFAKLGRIFSKGEGDPIGDDAMRGMRMWLLPEEAVYLVERGSIDLRWPAMEDDEHGEGLPMSLQAAYAMFMGDGQADAGALTFERYSVYSSLKRGGFTVLRSKSWDSPGPPPGADCYPPLPQRTWQAGLFSLSWLTTMFTKNGMQADQGTVVPGIYRSYADIYKRLHMIQWHDPATVRQSSHSQQPSTDTSLRVTYEVWKPGNTTFKKSDTGPPDFRIAVVNARESRAPSLEQLSALLETVPYEAPKPDAQLYQKLKHGQKSVILAIVDQGIVSYLRFADAAFGREKLYERKPKGPGGKRGGGKGGRGRGR